MADLGATLHTNAIVPLEQAYNPLAPIQPASPGPDRPQPAGHLTVELDKVTLRGATGVEVTDFHLLYVATPAVLGRYGITPAQIDPTADLVSGRSDLSGLRFFAPDLGVGIGLGAGVGVGVGVGAQGSDQPQQPGLRPRLPGAAQPTIQTLRHLPTYPSEPSTLITPHAMETLGLQAIPTGWLIQANGPLTGAQITTATRAAASAGLYVETRTTKKSLAPLRNWSTAAGGLVALGVLGMTVGLIRSETTNDLRTLTATGASSATRRTLTGATSGALGLLGAVLGTAGAYAALLAWHRSNLSPLGHVPVVNLGAIVAGLPAIAFIAGWLLAGREPATMARRTLE
jgi:putative ABC transport system permease protein